MRNTDLRSSTVIYGTKRDKHASVFVYSVENELAPAWAALQGSGARAVGTQLSFNPKPAGAGDWGVHAVAHLRLPAAG